MLTEKDITKGQVVPKEYLANLKELLEKLKVLEVAYGQSFTISSGFRSMEKHLSIYAQKGITDKAKIPLKSKHLFCQAADIYDPKKEIQAWIKANNEILNELNLFLEDFNYTDSWLHVQIVPFKSYVEGKSRFFIP